MTTATTSVYSRLVANHELVERGRVALPRQQDRLLVRHTAYRPVDPCPGWVGE
jgi:hypothetical protein